MSEDSQIVVPPSFIALYLAPGRSRPSAPRDEIAARYEFCEDLAAALTDSAASTRWQLGIDASDVLDRVHRGLLGGAAGVAPSEAAWVVRRLAELLEWDCDPAIGAPGE